MEQQSMRYEGAVEVVTITAAIDDFGYWSLRVCRLDRAVKRWNISQYDGLTADELCDVLDIVFDRS